MAELEVGGYFEDASQQLEQQRLQRSKAEEPSILGYNTADDQARIAEKSLGGRALGDVGDMSYGLLTLAAKGVTGAITLPYNLATKPTETMDSLAETGKIIGGSVVKGFKDPAAAAGLLGEEEKELARTYYNAHPGFAALDALGIATVGGGTLVKGLLTGMIKAAKKSVLIEATKVGIKGSVIDAAMMTTRSALNPSRLIHGAEKASSPVYNAMVKSAQAGNTGHIEEVLRSQFIKQGVDEKIAVNLAKTAGQEIAGQLLSHSKKFKVLDSIVHPLSATGRATSPLIERITGQPNQSAVASVFGDAAVQNNRRASLEVEQWLDSIVTKEQGLPSTVNNRAEELMTWMRRPEYSALPPEERFAHFANFIKADTLTAKLRQLTGNDAFIPVKVVSKDAAETMRGNVADNIETISKEIGEDANAGNVVDRIWAEISDVLEQTSGRDFVNNQHALRAAFGVEGSLDKLYAAIDSLTHKRSSVDFSEWSGDLQKFADELEGTGYRIGVAPSDKPISLVSDVLGKKSSKITENILDNKRTFVGKALDRWGFSTRGTVQGSNSFMFNQSFYQYALTELGKKFGGVLTVKNAFGLGKTIKVPVTELYDFLSKNIGKVNKANATAAEGKLFRLSEFFNEAQEKRTVFDFDAKDLHSIGFSKEVADMIDQISRKSLREIPLSVTGMGDKIVNLMRGGSKDLLIYGRHFDRYIKLATHARYKSAAAFMFQAQQGVETTMQGAMLVGGKYVPGAGTLLKMTSALPDNVLGGIFGRTKNVLRKMTFVPDPGDVALTEKYLIQNINRGLDDVTASIELSQVQKQLSQSSGVLSGGKLKNMYRSHIQMWAIDKATKINMAVAEKFGMTYKEVFALNEKGGFKNPNLVREMQEMSQQLLSYKQGFLTSPMAKTLNLVFFPFRFQMKTMDITAKWLGNLSPASRVVFVDNLAHFSNWAGTEEGIEWRRTHQNFLYSVMAYVSAYEQIGESINAVGRGQFFGGNTGLIGGIPFAWMVDFARDLAIIPEDTNSYDPKTGQPFELRETPRTVSAAGVKLIEEYLFTLMPGMPFYTITGGVITQASFRHLMQNMVEGVYGGALLKYNDLPTSAKNAIIREQFMKVPMDETVPLLNR